MWQKSTLNINRILQLIVLGTNTRLAMQPTRLRYKHILAKMLMLLSFFSAACFPANYCRAQAEDNNRNYLIKHFSDESSLPQNSVRSLQMDNKGFIWLATENGLVRYDGKNFRIFSADNDSQIKSNRIQQIFRDASGKLSILDGTNNLIALDENCQRTRQFETSAHTFNIVINENLIRTKLKDSSILNNRHLFFKFNNIVNAAAGSDYYSINENKGYVVTAEGYLLYLDSARIDTVPGIKPGRPYFAVFVLNNSLFCINSNGICSEIAEGRVVRTDIPAVGQFFAAQNLKATNRHPSALQSSWKNTCYIFSGTTIFLITLEKGVIQSKPLYTGLPKIDCMSMKYFPAAGMFGLGTYSQGLYLLQRKQFQIIQSTDETNQSNNFYAQVELPGNQIFTSNGILVSEAGQTTRVMPQQDFMRFSLLVDRNNNLYYGRDGFLKRSTANLTSDTIFSGTPLRESLLQSLIQASNGDIWFAAYQSVYRLKDNQLQKISITTEPNFPAIECLFEYDSTTFWVGTRSGLYTLNLNTFQIRPIDRMRDKYIRVIKRSKEGLIFIGTYGHGYYISDGSRFTEMPADDNRYLSATHSFVEDNLGYIWMPTNKGLFRASKADMYQFVAGKKSEIYYLYFDKSDGFATNEFNGGCTPSAIRLSNGTVSLPSLNGLVWFNPDSMQLNLPSNGIFVDEISGTGNVSSCEVQSLHFTSRTNVCTLKISCPYYGNTANLTLQYRLFGADSVWKEVRQNNILFQNLAAGNYSLEIRKKNDPGNALHIKVIVDKEWQEALWVKLLLFAVFIALVFLTAFMRTRYLKRQQQVLDSLVKQRTTELTKSNEVNNQLISVLAHDLKSPLRFIASLSNRLNREYTPGAKLNPWKK